MIKQFELPIEFENTIFKSRDGYSFEFNNKRWKLNKNITVPVGTVLNLLSAPYKSGFLRTQLFFAQNRSATYCHITNSCILEMLRITNSGNIDESTLINYRVTRTINTEWRMANIRTFLKQWYELGYDGINNDLIDFLYSFRLGGSIKGDVVKRMDPLNGPFTDIELHGLNEAFIQAYETGKIDIEKLALVMITSASGRRPIQISQLRVKDVLIGQNKKSEPYWLINFPRAKQRGALFREQFSQFAITEDLYVILNAQISDIKKRLQCQFSFKLTDCLVLDLPLFPDYAEIHKHITQTELEDLQKSDRLHLKSEKISRILQSCASSLDIQSERTGEPLNVTAYRYRYSLGTRAAREGLGVMAIAELLDHSDNQNASIYIQNIPEHAAKIDEAVGFQLAPIAQAFAGVLIHSESEAIRGSDLRSRIRINGDGIGNCGSFGFCGANVPVPCYTCIHFQPWLNGPHEILYKQLLDDRERIIKATGDLQIAAVNDRSILAVANVIQLCRLRKEELADGQSI